MTRLIWGLEFNQVKLLENVNLKNVTHLTLGKALAIPGRVGILIRGLLENVDLKKCDSFNFGQSAS